MEKKITTVILDFGGVVITSDQVEAVRRLEVLGIGPSVMPLDKYTQTGLIGDLEEGRITADEFRDALNQKVGRQNTHDDYRWAIVGYVKELPQRNLQLLRRLRSEGYRLLLLSNTNPYMMSWAMSPEFDGQGGALSTYFDRCYLSYEMGLAKPDAAIFQRMIEEEHLDPSTAIFVDDNEKNVLAAQRLGLHTLQPINGEDWTHDLLRSLI